MKFPRAFMLAIGLCAATHLATVRGAVGTLADGEGVVTWGQGLFDQFSNAPTSGVFTAIDAGNSHAVGVRSDGSIVTWGNNGLGQYSNAPTSGQFIAVTAGGDHNVGLRSDGSIATWGNSTNGQYTNSPTSGAFRAVVAGDSHNVGLRSDGSVITWGNNSFNQYANSPIVGQFTAVAAGRRHSLGLRSDGSVITWGDNTFNQYANSPTAGVFTSVVAGYFHSVGLRSDGSVVTWGSNAFNQYANSPAGGQFVAVAAGADHSVGLRSDGTVVTWGDNGSFQYVNSPTMGGFAAIAAGFSHSIGLRNDGSVVTWGDNSSGQYINSPTSGTFTAIAAGGDHNVALVARTSYDGDLLISGSGANANLNRSVSVAGDMIVQAPITFYNNPTATVSGKATFAPGSFLNGSGAIVANGIEILGDPGAGQGVGIYDAGQRFTTTGGLSGTGALVVAGTGVEFQLGLAAASTWTGQLFIGAGATTTVTGQGSQTAGWLNNGIYPLGYPQPSPGGELRMRPGQRLVFTSTAPMPSEYPTTNYNGGKIELAGSVLQGTSEIEFVGSLTNAPSTGLIAGQSSTMRFTGGLDNRGAVALTAGLNNVSGDVNNIAGGKIDVVNGASAVFYDDVVQNGVLRVAKVGLTNSTAVFLGAFTGSGGSTGGGDIFFEGDLRPGNSPASVTFANNVSLGDGAVTRVELAGTTVGAQYDKINVTGALALDGALVVSLLGGFAPAAGNAFDVLDWGSLSGAFDSVSLPALASNLAWNTTQLYMTGALSVGYAGDFNFDGRVDGADLLVWQRGGSPTPLSAGDLNAWKATFGLAAAVAATQPAPEPASWLLGAGALAVTLIRLPQRPR